MLRIYGSQIILEEKESIWGWHSHFNINKWLTHIFCQNTYRMWPYVLIQMNLKCSYTICNEKWIDVGLRLISFSYLPPRKAKVNTAKKKSRINILGGMFACRLRNRARAFPSRLVSWSMELTHVSRGGWIRNRDF